MQPELLLFDIGNTCIKVGLADSRGVTTSYNLRTDPAQTSDSLGLTLLELLRHAGAEPRFTACVASSVVPGFDPLLREAVTDFWNSRRDDIRAGRVQDAAELALEACLPELLAFVRRTTAPRLRNVILSLIHI